MDKEQVKDVEEKDKQEQEKLQQEKLEQEEARIKEEERKKRVNTIVQDIKEIDLKEIDNPYELILLLIEKANSLKEENVDILNFKLADITSDYLKLMENIEDIDMEVSADFIQIASTLIKIKSEKLLPRPDEVELIDAEEEERRILIATNEYRIFRDAAQKLSAIEDYNKKYRDPAPFANNYRIVLKQMSIDNLLKAFTKMMQKVVVQSKNPVQTIEKDRWTVEDKMFEIQTLLFGRERLQFFSLIEDDYTKGEIINLFLALLELIRRNEITILQEDVYGEITIYKVEQDEENIEEYNYIENFEDEE
ncbi:MAG: segregation/condensation protein A [Clostridia bacterium]|nr:segregation/condensation protein A [Clostridia bacterium]